MAHLPSSMQINHSVLFYIQLCSFLNEPPKNWVKKQTITVQNNPLLINHSQPLIIICFNSAMLCFQQQQKVHLYRPNPSICRCTSSKSRGSIISSCCNLIIISAVIERHSFPNNKIISITTQTVKGLWQKFSSFTVSVFSLECSTSL